MAVPAKQGVSEKRREFYERLAAKNTAPLWESLAELIPSEPRPRCLPAHWRYQDLRPLLLEAGGLITAREAARRVLMIENPGLRGLSQITGSLYAGLQLVLPGEVTSTHRHTMSALRFIVEGEGAYTAVDGERVTMHPGDFIVTPSWTYHDHGNPSNHPMIWLDGLDIPIVNLFNASFAEDHPEGTQKLARSEGVAQSLFAAGMLPLEYSTDSLTSPLTSPLFSYPYERSRGALARLAKEGPPHAVHGYKMQYANPATGGCPMPTIAAFLQLLPAGFRGGRYRSTDATVYCVADGSGESRIGESRIEWTRSDVFVAPSWTPVSHTVDAEAVLFSFSDRVAQKALGVWREQELGRE